ncbi:MAG: AAA domain-containing protein [Bacteroidetes bacterium]|nr:AAA domain-containing protein [Bacteroidota bacterium]
MNISIEKHIEFYNLEITSILEKWDNYLSKQMRILISEKDLFIGRLWAYEEKSGMFILRFKSSEVPRINTPYFIGFLGNGVVGNPSNWDFTYREFRESEKVDYWSKRGGEANIISYWKTEEQWSFIIINIVDPNLHDFIIREFIEKKIQPLLVVAETDPPLDYLLNLKEYLEYKLDDKILDVDIEKDAKSWKPINLDNSLSVLEKVLPEIENNKITTIQGPPGTGKSYFAAQVCDYYMSSSKSIAVCAMTNKALMEIVGQPPLKETLKKGFVYKTSLTKDETIKERNLRLVDRFTPKQGELLLTTYYQLSGFYFELCKDVKRFDLLIIEEASQAFLATLSMFSQIADKILIIGDHKQLPPIVVSSDKKLINIHPNIYALINGLEIFVYNEISPCYRFTKTRRLTTNCAELTGNFYDNQLESISEIDEIAINREFPLTVFDKFGGVSISKLSKAGNNSISEYVIFKSIVLLTKTLLEKDNNINISILVPTINLEKEITQAFSRVRLDHKRIIISTVQKVQGLTCDYTFYYMPLTHVFMELNDNLFNVVTSRAKKGCFIITYRHLNLIEGISFEVNNFIKGCLDVTKEFIEITQKITD